MNKLDRQSQFDFSTFITTEYVKSTDLWLDSYDFLNHLCIRISIVIKKKTLRIYCSKNEIKNFIIFFVPLWENTLISVRKFLYMVCPMANLWLLTKLHLSRFNVLLLLLEWNVFFTKIKAFWLIGFQSCQIVVNVCYNIYSVLP